MKQGGRILSIIIQPVGFKPRVPSQSTCNMMFFKGFKFGANRFSIRGFLAAIFHPIMSSPCDVPGVFIKSNSRYSVEDWQAVISGNEVSSQCQLEKVIYCKCTGGKEHEFLLFHFRHPTQQNTEAVLVSDRTPDREGPNNHDDDDDNNNNNNNLSFLKRMFPDCFETNEGAGCSSYRGLTIAKADSVDEVYKQYCDEWAHIEEKAANSRREKEKEVQQLRIEAQAEERARCQAEIEQVTRQKEEAMRQKEEAMRRADEVERQKEEAVRRAEERVREMQAEMDQMRAQYERHRSALQSQYNLIVDTGSSNTWVNASTPYVKTSTSVDTDEAVSVTYNSGSFSGTKYIDTITLGNGLAINKLSISVASTSVGFTGVDGILGIGPLGLTEGTLTDSPHTTIPTVTINMYSQGTIYEIVVGVSFEPTATETNSNGELTFGVIDISNLTHM
ncbi:acid protease [Suillus decipiens]|nr:acid protease [Suillus decipiens]